jgi:MFS family permease
MKKFFYGWWIVAGAFILLFCASGSHFYAFPVFFEAMIKDMGWSRAETAATLSISMFINGVTGIIVGSLIRQIGIRKIMICGSIVAGIGFLLLSSVTRLWQFYVYYGFILSIGIGSIALVPNLTAVENWFQQKRSTALGIANAGIGTGGAVMAPLAAWLISRYDWQTAFLFLATMVTVIGISVSAIIMRNPTERELSQEEHQGKMDKPPVEGVTLHAALRSRAFWCISVGVFLWAFAYSTGVVHQVAYAVDMGIDKVAAAGAVGLLAAFSIPGRLGFGRLGDIIDKRYLFMIGTSLQLLAYIVLMRTNSTGMLYIYAFLIGINVGGMSPILPGLLADHFGHKYFGTIYGVAVLFLTMGNVVGPIFGGWIFDNTGRYFTAFLTASLLSFVAVIIVYLSGKPTEEVIHVTS